MSEPPKPIALVVDDEVQIRRLLRVCLESDGYRVHEAATGQEAITEAARKTFDLRPGMIIKELQLLRPIYRKTACYGHFGRTDPDFTWEKTDKVAQLKKLVS